MYLSKIIKEKTTAKQRVLIRNRVKRIFAFFCTHNLNRLAAIYGSDKGGTHAYTQHYNFHFKLIRKKS